MPGASFTTLPPSSGTRSEVIIVSLHLDIVWEIHTHGDVLAEPLLSGSCPPLQARLSPSTRNI